MICMYTLELAGRPVAVTDRSEEEAGRLFASPAFKADLAVLQDPDGHPIWDGPHQQSSDPIVRRASPEEVAHFQSVIARRRERTSANGHHAFALMPDLRDPTASSDYGDPDVG